jgi:hypothetical protein
MPQRVSEESEDWIIGIQQLFFNREARAYWAGPLLRPRKPSSGRPEHPTESISNSFKTHVYSFPINHVFPIVTPAYPDSSGGFEFLQSNFESPILWQCTFVDTLWMYIVLNFSENS